MTALGRPKTYEQRLAQQWLECAVSDLVLALAAVDIGEFDSAAIWWDGYHGFRDLLDEVLP